MEEFTYQVVYGQLDSLELGAVDALNNNKITKEVANRRYNSHLLLRRAVHEQCVELVGADVITEWNRKIENMWKRKN